MAKSYEYIASIGEECAAATELRRRGLRDSSSPFDWLRFMPFGERIDLVLRGFAGFLEKDRLEQLPVDPSVPNKGFDHYRDTATGLVFFHDFRRALPFEREYDVVAGKYARRVSRMLERLKSEKSLLVWYAQRNPPPSPESVAAAEAKLRERFGNENISILVCRDLRELDGVTRPGALRERLRTSVLRFAVRILSAPFFTRERRMLVRRRLSERFHLP